MVFTVERSGGALEDEIVPRAAAIGYRFVQYETELGQLVFEWRRGEEIGPQFLTRHLALLWMVERLESVPAR